MYYQWSALAFYRGGILLEGDEKRQAARSWALANDNSIYVFPNVRREQVDFGDLLDVKNSLKTTYRHKGSL